jgi:transposase InsO family protein
MRIRNNFKGTKGFLSLYEITLKWQNMRNQKEATRRVKALTFWKEHGLLATIDAFEVSRRTLFRWKKELDTAHGKLTALDPKSTAPKKRRQRIYNPEYIENVIQLRKNYGRVGKKKIAAMFGVSESYAGRTLTYLKERELLPQNKKLSLYARSGKLHERKRAKVKRKRRKNKRGMEIDTIVRFINGTKRYILTAIDVERKFAFAGAYTNHSSLSAKDFLLKLKTVCPFKIEEIQTDNGSEFAHHFHSACDDLGITHYHTYPRCPKMNAYIERFNRTISEGFIMRNRMLLAIDIDAFNEKLIDWLLWYNGKRPHQSLGMISPLQFIVREMGLSTRECQKWWTSTHHCKTM